MNIDGYLKRINYQGPLDPTLQTFQALHAAHMLAVPFENLSIHYAQPIVLQEEMLYDKVVLRYRGGFCYELNGLFAQLLRQLGFQVTLLSAGVAHPNGGFTPDFDHLALHIHQLEEVDWLADVGFGDSFRRPLRLEAAVEQEGADGRIYRLLREYVEGDGKQLEYWVLQQLNDDQWKSRYHFTLQSWTLPDFTERCQYQQTSPDSHFTQQRICSLATHTGRISLSNLRLIETIQGERKENLLTSEEEYLATLAKRFGIVL